MSPCKIAIACEYRLICALFRNSVSETSGVKVVGEACGTLELLEMLKNSEADIVFLDGGLLKKRGKTTITQIKGLLPKVKIFVIHNANPQVSLALANCVDGCFSAQHAPMELNTAIETIRQQG